MEWGERKTYVLPSFWHGTIHAPTFELVNTKNINTGAAFVVSPLPVICLTLLSLLFTSKEATNPEAMMMLLNRFSTPSRDSLRALSSFTNDSGSFIADNYKVTAVNLSSKSETPTGTERTFFLIVSPTTKEICLRCVKLHLASMVSAVKEAHPKALFPCCFFLLQSSIQFHSCLEDNEI
jgi:hypothetical protein